MIDTNFDHSHKMTEEDTKRLKQDFEISEQDKKRVDDVVTQLHTICEELELPMIVAVTISKTTVIDEERGEGESSRTLTSLHLNGGRVPDDVLAAAMILESDRSIPLPLVHMLTS